jgi:hypothetical protein
MKFYLTIDLGNDAMQTMSDIAVALRGVSFGIFHAYGGDMASNQRGRLSDINGNTVGHWEVRETDRD